MELRGNWSFESILKVKTNRARNVLGATTICGKARNEVWINATSVWVIGGFSRAVRSAENSLTKNLRCKVALIGKSVVWWAACDPQYVSGKCLRAKCAGGNGKWIFETDGNFGTGEKGSGVAGMFISHVGELLISGYDLFISRTSEILESEFGVNVFEEIESIYLGMGVEKVPNEFSDDANIFAGGRNSPGVTWISNNRGVEIQDISILPSSAKQTDEPLTGEEQVALRYGLGDLCGLLELRGRQRCAMPRFQRKLPHRLTNW